MSPKVLLVLLHAASRDPSAQFRVAWTEPGADVACVFALETAQNEAGWTWTLSLFRGGRWHSAIANCPTGDPTGFMEAVDRAAAFRFMEERITDEYFSPKAG